MKMTETEAPTTVTRETLRKAREDQLFNWQDERDFDFAQRGLIAKAPLIDIENSAGEVVWGVTDYDAFLDDDRPDTIHPSLWRLAQLNNERGLYRVTEGVYQVRGHALANITFIRGQSGYIVIDANNTVEIASFALKLFFEHVEPAPITAIILSHTHSDHWGGIRGIVDADNTEVRVIVPTNFVEYVHSETFVSNEGLNTRCNYKSGELLPKTAWGQVDAGLGRMTEAGVVSYLTPTDIIPEDGAEMTIDGIPLIFQNAPGEAPAAMHVYLPEQKTLFIADNAYAALQNIYTIRGALSRDPLLWYESIRQAMTFNEAEILIGGHHWPRFGREEIRGYLQKQGDVLKYQHDQTVRLMSHGYTPVEIANTLTLPPSLAGEWYLRGYYGAVKHNVRAIYDRYLGWYDGNPATLDPVPPREAGQKMLEYMGGMEAVVKRATEDFEQGNYRWVAQILDAVLWAKPNHTEARELAAKAHTQLGYLSENATWRNAYLSAADELRNGLPTQPSGIRHYDQLLTQITPQALLDVLALHLNGPAVFGKTHRVQWHFSDVNENHVTYLENAVLHSEQTLIDNPDAAITLTRDSLRAIVAGEATLDKLAVSGEVVITGDRDTVIEFFDCLDDYPTWFPVTSHELKNYE